MNKIDEKTTCPKISPNTIKTKEEKYTALTDSEKNELANISHVFKESNTPKPVSKKLGKRALKKKTPKEIQLYQKMYQQRRAAEIAKQKAYQIPESVNFLEIGGTILQDPGPSLQGDTLPPLPDISSLNTKV